MCKLVGDVEELVERANRAAAAVQVGASSGRCAGDWHVRASAMPLPIAQHIYQCVKRWILGRARLCLPPPVPPGTPPPTLLACCAASQPPPTRAQRRLLLHPPPACCTDRPPTRRPPPCRPSIMPTSSGPSPTSTPRRASFGSWCGRPAPPPPARRHSSSPTRQTARRMLARPWRWRDACTGLLAPRCWRLFRFVPLGAWCWHCVTWGVNGCSQVSKGEAAMKWHSAAWGYAACGAGGAGETGG